jgi:hypothetical protein
MTKARQLADLGNAYDDGALSNRNLIINGAMKVAQRGTSLSIAPAENGYSVDRFKIFTYAMDQLSGTFAQVSDAPSGFASSLKWTTGTAESAVTDSEYHSIEYSIEAQDLQHLNYGSSDAKTITLSFWVKSSVADDFGLSVYKQDTTNRVINPTYTINSANTWEYKTITILGDTASSASIVNDTGIGLLISWGIGCGPVYSGTPNTSWGNYSNPTWLGSQTQSTVTTTSGATFQITGVQLEVGDTATPFEHRSYGDELAKCQRYYYMLADGLNQSIPTGSYYNANLITTTVQFPVTMRSAPTIDSPSGSEYYGLYSDDGFDGFSNFSSTGRSQTRGITLDAHNTGASGTTGFSGPMKTNNANAYVALDAEL